MHGLRQAAPDLPSPRCAERKSRRREIQNKRDAARRRE